MSLDSADGGMYAREMQVRGALTQRRDGKRKRINTGTQTAQTKTHEWWQMGDQRPAVWGDSPLLSRGFRTQ